MYNFQFLEHIFEGNVIIWDEKLISIVNDERK